MRTTQNAGHPCKPSLASLAALLALAFPLSGQDAADLSPWTLLEGLREDMQSSGPMTSRFVQTYIPAGFSDGDTESGHLSMWLPDCLRWNYEEPQTKNFLVCQGEVYYWSEDGPGGRHYEIDPEKEAGLDLLLVPVSTLRQRYVASTENQDDGSLVIALATPPAQGGSFSARIRLDASKTRVAGLEYTDDEGNLTRFQLTEYQRLSHTALFKPPGDIEWTEE